MATQQTPRPNPQQMTQTWEAAAKSLTDGWRQAQDFWNNVARSWADVASTWMSQLPQAGAPMSPMSGEATAAWRELQEAAFAVGQAWMRLPLVLSTGGQPSELQEA